MSLPEVSARTVDQVRRAAWARRQVAVGAAAGVPARMDGNRRFSTPLAHDARNKVSADARDRLVAAADRLLAGSWTILGTPRPDIVAPDWFLDPVTGRRAPQDVLAFRVDHRDEAVTGNVKSVWELSRHHHLTVLAGAYWVTQDDRYADVVADQLRSWWRENPFLSGVHWTSGIEVGIRLVSWAWIRRLLDDWPKASDLFEGDEAALRQIWWHQRYLASFPSRGSSANNHAVAEAAGRLVAACAFPWYAESERWRTDSAQLLERTLSANTFRGGVNRELATDYHRFVTELGLVAAAEADAAGHSLSAATWSLLTRSLDAAAAMVDVRGHPPRQGDGDDGRVLVIDDPDEDAWSLLLGLGSALVGRCPWWPATRGDVRSTAVGSIVADSPTQRPRTAPDRPRTAPVAFPDAGMYLLRTPPEDGPEIWCRCDGGPHGFLSIAAHAHADALSVEVRYDGAEILVDPGTYCYHGEPEWRSYFRSTLAHNTLEIDGSSQSVEGGPFLWSTQVGARVTRADVADSRCQVWSAVVDAYGRLGTDVRHARTVMLDSGSRHVLLIDVVSAQEPRQLRLAFHLGPDVTAEVNGTIARLHWRAATGAVSADLLLPWQLSWTLHRAETDPILGWYSPRFGERIPTTTVLGTGTVDRQLELRTLVVFPSA